MANRIFESWKEAEKYEGYPKSLTPAPWDWKNLCPEFDFLADDGFTIDRPETKHCREITTAFYYKRHLWTVTYSNNSHTLEFEYKESEKLISGTLDNLVAIKKAIKEEIAGDNGACEIVQIWECSPEWRKFKVHFYWGNEIKETE